MGSVFFYALISCEETFEASAASSSAPGDFAPWTHSRDGTILENRACFRVKLLRRPESSRANGNQRASQKMNTFIFWSVRLIPAACSARRTRGKAALPGNGGTRLSRTMRLQHRWRQTQVFFAAFFFLKESAYPSIRSN